MPEHRLFEYQGHYLVKRTDTPHYHIYWCRPGTRRVRRKSAHTADLEQAKQRLIEFVHERHRPRDGSPDTVSIHDALNEYVERTLADKPSQRKALGILSRFSEFLDREDITFISELTLDAQDRYIAWRRRTLADAGHTASNGTIQRELNVLRAAIRTFWKRGYLQSVPYVRSLPSPPPRQRFLRPDEVRRLLAECDEPHLYRFVMLALHTLQRPGAVLSLDTRQVDLDRGLIDFLPPGAIQTRKRRPIVPISNTLRPLLEQAVRESQSGRVIEFEGRPVKAVRRSFNTARDRAGLGPDVTPYTLRHTGATLLASRGVPLRQIAGMLGHTEMATTELYAKHHPDFLQTAIDSLDHMFGS